MKVYDISMPVFYEMPVYKGRISKRPIITVESNFSTGAVYESRLEMNLHTGTHLDAPLHLLAGGGTIDSLALESVICKCKVLDLTHVADKITKEDLIDKKIDCGDFILLKTRNSFEALLEGKFIYLDHAGAEYLVSQNVIGVGIDALGIEREQPGHPTHKALLGNDRVIIEGLRLKSVPEGQYLLVAAPIKIMAVEAAPVRALLFEQKIINNLQFVE